MQEKFNEFIDGINPDFWRQLCLSEGEPHSYDAGEEFVRVGNVARYVGYIKTGTMKYTAFSPEGDEHVVGLEFAGEFIADFPFSLYGKPSRISIIATTPCEIYRFPVTELARRLHADAALKDIVMHATEAIFSTVYDRYLALYTQTPQQRYDQLVSRHPDLFVHFPLKDIASFLGITPTHLSRLRKK